MVMSRSKHSREFKLQAVRRVVEQGRSIAELADRLGINCNMLARRKSEIEAEGPEAFRGNGKLRFVDEEVCDLRRRLAVADEERDILKKALGYFAKPKR